MRLLIISHTPHYQTRNGVVGWGPTVREINYLARLFDTVIHIAWLYRDLPPASALPYHAPNVRFIGVSPSGGNTLLNKMDVLRKVRSYMETVVRYLKIADVVHVRCPANISLTALLVLAATSRPRYRWVKYAGNWRPNGREPWSYTFQRWWLNKGLHHGVVTINGRWPGQPKHVYSFLNPSLTIEEVEQARTKARQKELKPPYVILFVGRIEAAKGVGRALQVVERLAREGVPFKFHLVGDGKERAYHEAWVKEQGLANRVYFHGWVPRTALGAFYEKAHFFLFPTTASEGWPKVLSEAMAYGVVPLAGAVSSIPQILGETGAGRAFAPNNIDGFVNGIHEFLDNPATWTEARDRGLASARKFTYEAYLEAVREMFWEAWRIRL